MDLVVPTPARFAPARTPSFHSKRSCWAMPSQEKTMNTLKYTAAAIIVAVALAPSAAAGSNGMHRMPADYGKAQPVYELTVNAAPESGKPLIVTLIDRATGQAVPDAEVSVLRPAHHPLKASPAPDWIAVPLPRDGAGHFICAGEHHAPGSHIGLRGSGPNGTSPVTLDLTVKG
jgi:hypothetical protein